MPPIPYADNFLAGSILTLLLPIGLLIVIAVWYVLAIKRVPDGTTKPLPPQTHASDVPPGGAGTQTEPPTPAA
ncbi:MAG TPA: hypothetical protein VNR66_00020 [Solirubrobacteraceae bacterium]|jgi:hypothetical protein|nr:hypothetical protein [Solirubrobacteraceae bacterium]